MRLRVKWFQSPSPEILNRRISRSKLNLIVIPKPARAFWKIVKRYSIAHGKKFDPTSTVLTEIHPDGSLNLSMGNPVLGKKHFWLKPLLSPCSPMKWFSKLKPLGLALAEEVEYDLVEAVFGSGTPSSLKS